MNYRNKHTEAVKNEDMMSDTLSIVLQKYSSVKEFTLDIWDEATYESSSGLKFWIITHCDIVLHCHSEDQYLIDILANGNIEDSIIAVMPLEFIYKIEKRF